MGSLDFWLDGDRMSNLEEGAVWPHGSSWDEVKYLKPDDCDEVGYCVHCGTATVHFAGCIVLSARGSGE